MSELRVDEVDLHRVPGLASSPGRLGMTFLPGKHGLGRSGRHERNLDDDAATLARLGVDALVLLVEDHELLEAKVPTVVEGLAAQEVETVRFPIEDMDVPSDPMAFAALLGTIEGRLAGGEFVAVACLGGIGRTGTVVGCLLVQNGLPAQRAIALTRSTRPGTIETEDQESFVRRWRQ